jgi:PAS domain S-box-containing protein
VSELAAAPHEAPRSARGATSAFFGGLRGIVLLTMLVGAASLAATWAAWRTAHDQANRSRQEYFDYRVRDAQRRIERRIEAYDVVLRAAHAHFLAAEVTRENFRQFISSLRLAQTYPGIQGVGYAERVPRADLDAHVERVRAEGFPAYSIRPAGARDLYTSIVMLEPFAGRNLHAFGYDMYSEPVRRAAMQRSVALDGAVASGRVTLVQETHGPVQAGFLIYWPLFSTHGTTVRPASGDASRAEGLRGWVYAPFRMNDFMRGVFGERAQDVDIDLYDGNTTDAAALLFEGIPGRSSGGDDGAYVAVRRLEVAHRTWTMTVRARPGLVALLGTDHSSTVAWVGLFATALLMALTWSLARGRLQALALAADKTEGLRVAHEELRRIVRQQALILESANAGIIMVVDRKQIAVNRGMEEMFGYTREEMLGQSTRMYYPSDESFAAFGQAAYPVLAEGRAFEIEVELRRKDGRPLWTKYNGRAVDPAAPAKGSLWILTDHTAQREADSALRQSEARFRHFFESHSAVMLLIGKSDGAIIDANPAAARFYGYERAALRSMRISDLNVLPPGEIVEKLATAATRQENTFLFSHRLADGQLRRVEVNSSPAEVLGRPLLFSIVQDVTERERALENLAALNAALGERVEQAVSELRAKDQLLITQSRQAAMGEMIGNIAHQWRQPLNALGLILVNLHDASRHGELDAAVVEEAVNGGTQLVQRMSTTISDFRNFFRPEKQKHVFHALAQLQETARLLDAGFRSAGITVEFDAESELQLVGYANEYSQVFLNLLGNAKDAIQSRKVADGRVTVSLRAEGDRCSLIVRDNGGGIPEALLERIFEPYFSTKVGGTGIGLYMSRQIVERSMGGRISARNFEDGAEFVVCVPLGAEEPDAAPSS